MNYSFWFVVGSQFLYGPEVLETVAARAQEMAEELSKALPFPLLYKVTAKTNKEIADALCLSVHTVATHRKNISAKLEIHSTAGLAIFAILHKLVDIKDLNPYANRT